MTNTRTFPFPITNREDKTRLEVIRDAGDWHGYKIKEIIIGNNCNDILTADIVVYDDSED